MYSSYYRKITGIYTELALLRFLFFIKTLILFPYQEY